ncbi:MAG: type II toxin-antitoxin system VapC family toxin [Deltaproteobacteria bacterium]|nr:type II toxin-antitoxin system VapC family toxin [Deltaproteobacteria bacterium]MBW1819870.1 type II toxin-antitoxin system VapC family toxin [Deltaproteobacteria bacterium]
MTETLSVAVYWDASAVLSVLIEDNHSVIAHEWARKSGFHLLSTLAYAETCAVISRLERDRMLTDILVKAVFEVLEKGPWLRLNAMPEWDHVQPLASLWPLRGADLWHLAAAKTLQKRIPELHLLTFDKRLKEAATGERLCP